MMDVSRYRHLSLGCGMVRQDDSYLHVDIRRTPAVDVVMDLEKMPWPLPDNAFERVVAHDIVEHVDNAIGFMEEVWRVLKPEGLAAIRGPYYGHAQAYRALDHKHFFALDSMDLFIRGTEYHKGYKYYTHARFHKLECGYMGAEIVWQLQKAQTDEGKWTYP